jgi:hypothetical protein
MSLSGTVTTSVMWLVAAATFIWAVVSLAKATGTPGRVDLRTTYLRGAGTQLAVVATALLAVAGTLNAQYDWYSSWSDLGTAFQGGDSSAGSPELIRAGAGAAAAPIRTVREPQIRGLDPDPGPDGQYVTVTLLGPVSKVSSSVVLWLPGPTRRQGPPTGTTRSSRYSTESLAARVSTPTTSTWGRWSPDWRLPDGSGRPSW